MLEQASNAIVCNRKYMCMDETTNLKAEAQTSYEFKVGLYKKSERYMSKTQLTVCKYKKLIGEANHKFQIRKVKIIIKVKIAKKEKRDNGISTYNILLKT